MLLRAFAKINLDLKVLGRREDGYHEVRTILQTIDWYDEIHITPSDHFKFTCRGGPGDGSNLVVRALRAFETATGIPVLADVVLIKNVPIGAGLGGGSADAAVMLMGLQKLYGCTLPEAELRKCLGSLGSDVPFFAVGGRALGVGRGDEIALQDDDASYWLVIVHAGIMISTAEAYSWLTVLGESNTIKGFYAQFDSGMEAGLPGNDFEGAVFGHHPVLGEIKNELLRLGARYAAMSGSGSAMFGQFDREEDAVSAASALFRYGTARVARPLSRLEYSRRVIG